MQAGALDAVWLVLKHSGVPNRARMWMVRKINGYARVLTDDDREQYGYQTWRAHCLKHNGDGASIPAELRRIICQFRTTFGTVHEGDHCMFPSHIWNMPCVGIMTTIWNAPGH